MNYALVIIIIAMGCGGYFEYKAEQDKSAATQQQISDLTDQVSKLQADNKKLQDDESAMEKKLADAQSQTANGAASPAATQTAAPTQSVSPSPSAPAFSNNLGSFTTTDGKSFQNGQLLKVEADGIVVSHSAGITKVLFVMLTPDLQKKFGCDTNPAGGLTLEQVQSLENQRVTAAQATGH